jgi:hypothetical protein
MHIIEFSNQTSVPEVRLRYLENNDQSYNLMVMCKTGALFELNYQKKNSMRSRGSVT